jgi:hypothetical protein
MIDRCNAGLCPCTPQGIHPLTPFMPLRGLT